MHVTSAQLEGIQIKRLNRSAKHAFLNARLVIICMVLAQLLPRHPASRANQGDIWTRITIKVAVVNIALQNVIKGSTYSVPRVQVVRSLALQYASLAQ